MSALKSIPSDQIVRGVVEQVLRQIQSGKLPAGNGSIQAAVKAALSPQAPAAAKSGGTGEGVYATADEAVAAASRALAAFSKVGLPERKQVIDCIRKICREQAETLGREEFEETRIGKLEHKIDKLRLVADRIPGVEWLKTDAFSGQYGIALEEYGAFGVIGAITPVTHSFPTLACNAINMLAGGNTVVFNAHPSGARIAAKGVRLLNRAFQQAIGIPDLVTIIENPTIESAQAIFDHRDVKLICVTGGPALARAALRSPKRAVVAGPGNPPVVVDSTADLSNAAAAIIAGASYDNNLLCIGEKEVFATQDIFDELMDWMAKHGAVRLDQSQVERLTAAAFKTGENGKLMVNKDLIGQDAAVLARHAGLEIPAGTALIYAETDESNPFVSHEQMMPFVPFVRARCVNHAIDMAVEHEHGYGHTAIIHSRNLETITRMGRRMNTTLFVQNGPSVAGLGAGGEGYASFSIATPTGEGVTTPLTFCRKRRSSTVGSMRVV